MDEEFESFIIDPDLVDPGFDVSGLRTATDTRPELLFDLPEFSGIRVDPTRGSYIEDMYRAYSGQIPMLPETPAKVISPATGGGGGGSGDGGQGTDPVEIENQRLIDEGIGIQAEPGGPVFAPGEEPVTQDQIDAFNQIPVNTDYTIGSIDPVDDAIATTGLLPGIEFDPDTGTYDEANLIEGNQYDITAQDPTNMIPQTPTATVFDGTATLEDAGGVTAGIEDLGYATDFYGDPNEDLIERGAVPEEGGIIDRGRGQIPVDTRVTKDFEMPRGGGADIDIFDTTPQDSPITIENIGPGRAVVQPDGTIINIDPLEEQMLQETLRNELEGTDTFTPTLETETIDAAPNIVTVKPPVGVVDPFGGKYTMSTEITPEDTEQSIKAKVADFLGVTEDEIDMAAVTGVLNKIGGDFLKTKIPIASVATYGVPLVKKGIDKVVDIFTGGDDKDTTTITGVNPFDTADFGPETGEFDTTPTPPSPPQDTGGRGGGADRDPDPAPSAPKGPSGPPSVISKPSAPSKPSFGTGSGGLGDYQVQPSKPSGPTYGPPSQSSSGNDSTSSSSSSSCCFIMLEARYGDGTMDKVVRRYRDENMTPRNRRGYYKVAEVLVPLMRKSKIFKWIVTKTFADPLVSYGKWYYGENKHGWIFAPIKSAWLKLFDVVGTDTVFIRENGEEV